MYIRYGKAKGGLVGKSLSSEQVTEWVLSHHVCNMMSMKMDNMFSEEAADKVQEKVEFIKKRDAIEGNWMQWIDQNTK